MPPPEKNSFLLYNDQIELFKKLTPEQSHQLILKIFEYSTTNHANSIKDPVIDMAFTSIKTAMDRDKRKYIETCEKRKASGKMGGRPKANKPNGFEKSKRLQKKQNNQIKPNKADSDNDNESDSEF